MDKIKQIEKLINDLSISIQTGKSNTGKGYITPKEFNLMLIRALDKSFLFGNIDNSFNQIEKAKLILRELIYYGGND